MLVVREAPEAVPLVKRASAIVQCFDDHGHGGNLLRTDIKRPAQGIEEQYLSQTLALIASINREASQ